MEGKIAGDQASSKVARKELMALRDTLDNQMSQAFPEWGQYLGQYRAASTQADQARVGQTLLNRAGQAAGSMGERPLTAAVLARSANDPDALVRAATGFNRATAARTLTPQQSSLLSALGGDAQGMQAAANGGRAVGSNTTQNLATQNVLTNALGGGKLARLVTGLKPVQAITTPVEKYVYGSLGVPERLNATVVEMLQNPERAQQILNRLDSPSRAAIQRWISEGGAGLGIGMSASSRQPAATSP